MTALSVAHDISMSRTVDIPNMPIQLPDQIDIVQWRIPDGYIHCWALSDLLVF